MDSEHVQPREQVDPLAKKLDFIFPITFHRKPSFLVPSRLNFVSLSHVWEHLLSAEMADRLSTKLAVSFSFFFLFLHFHFFHFALSHLTSLSHTYSYSTTTLLSQQ